MSGLKVGDMVKVLPHPVGEYAGDMWYPREMKDFIGDVLEIIEHNDHEFRLSNLWNYLPEHLELYSEESGCVDVNKIKIGSKVKLTCFDLTRKKFGYTNNMLKIGECGVVTGIFQHNKEVVLNDEYSYHVDDLELVLDENKEQFPEEFDISPEQLKEITDDMVKYQNEYDVVSKPKHYNTDDSGVQCIELTRHMSFNYGNMLKYVWRIGKKDDSKQEIEKALWYLNDAIENGIPVFNDQQSQSVEFENKILEVMKFSSGWKYVLLNAIYWSDHDEIKRALNGILNDVNKT